MRSFTTEEVKTMLDGLGIPVAYYQFPETIQGPPFICYYYDTDNDMKADNSNYVKIESLVIELYTDYKDFDMEAELEGLLKTNGISWRREEQFIDTEQMHETIYTTEVIING